VHGQYRFSALDMLPPEKYAHTGGRLTGTTLSKYMETFTEKFLKDKAKFRLEVEVMNIRRNKKGMWLIKAENLRSGLEEILTFSRIILSTGVCVLPVDILSLRHIQANVGLQQPQHSR
jgi:dimethylaniline monooxygenase (N-oxide forming)